MQPIEPSLGSSDARLRLRTLVLIRWIAILGQTAALIVVAGFLDFPLPVVPCAAAVLALAAVNLTASIAHRGRTWLSERQGAGYLAFDLLQLTVLLGLTGGLANPFALLLLAPVAVSAASLSPRSMALLALLAVAAASGLAFWHLPLPWLDNGLVLPPLYRAGIWLALALSIVFTALYVFSLARQSRQLAEAYAATQAALAREQQLSALGSLAAAAAHELGSPLATISLVSKELERAVAGDDPLREDIVLLREEAERCREILAALTADPKQDSGAPYDRVPLTTLVEMAAEPYRRGSAAAFAIDKPGEASGPEPLVWRSPELVHGLGTLIQNALQFAASRVTARLSWDAVEIAIALSDDGPGFSESVLGELGTPFVSTGARDLRGGSGHLGLGVFIARSLLGRFGGELRYRNLPQRPGEGRRAGGALVEIRWPRAQIEADSGARAKDRSP
ncbi:MAG: ActS/PrrB/RegB family redox-sensitive histidine kinase [Rhodovibrionaceae bacterium]